MLLSVKMIQIMKEKWRATTSMEVHCILLRFFFVHAAGTQTWNLSTLPLEPGLKGTLLKLYSFEWNYVLVSNFTINF